MHDVVHQEVAHGLEASLYFCRTTRFFTQRLHAFRLPDHFLVVNDM
jgi:hypothetical protein